MTKPKRWLVLVVLIVSALVCYALAGIVGLGLFIALGLVFELMFWFGLFTRNKKSNSD